MEEKVYCEFLISGKDYLISICRRIKIVKELLSTEKSYVEDIQIVISGYRDKE